MSFEWFGGTTLRSFWTPIIDPGQKWYRDLHVKAHVIGGLVWDVVFHFLALGTVSGLWISFASSAWLRLLGVGLVQLTLWEMIQRENWRPELLTPPGEHGTGYPWLSAIWDVLFTLAGAAALELLLFVLHLVVLS